MTEQGTVVEVHDHMAKIALKSGAQCGQCSATHLCSLGRGEFRHFEMENAVGAETGDVVEIHLSSQNVFLSAFLVYIAPLVMLAAGYVVGKALTGSEHLAVGAAILALTASYVGLRLVDKRVAKGGQWSPAMTRVISRRAE